MKHIIITTDHEEIKSWANALRGQPQIIDDPSAKGDEQGIRIDFPGAKDEEFMPEGEIRDIAWREFFKKFEQAQLAFVAIDLHDLSETDDPSYAYRFMKREVVQHLSQKDFQKLKEDFLKTYFFAVSPR